jgi:hypothetical protein
MASGFVNSAVFSTHRSRCIFSHTPSGDSYLSVSLTTLDADMDISFETLMVNLTANFRIAGCDEKAVSN